MIKPSRSYGDSFRSLKPGVVTAINAMVVLTKAMAGNNLQPDDIREGLELAMANPGDCDEHLDAQLSLLNMAKALGMLHQEHCSKHSLDSDDDESEDR